MGLTGPINFCIFIPGFMVYNATKEDRFQPLWGRSILPLFDLEFSLDEAFLVQLAAKRSSLEAVAMIIGALLLIWYGLGLYIRAFQLFHEAGGTTSREDPPPTLVVSGPYQYVRPPLSPGGQARVRAHAPKADRPNDCEMRMADTPSDAPRQRVHRSW